MACMYLLQVGCEWVAQAINKVHVQKAAKEEDCWRYIMHWHRLPHVNSEVSHNDFCWTVCAAPYTLSCLATSGLRGGW